MLRTLPARRALLLAGVALAALGAAAPARAQDAAATELPEVQVQGTAWKAWQPIRGYVAPLTTTGTKTDTPLIEAPQSLGVVTRDQMDDQGATTVSQALRYTAGVQGEVRPGVRYDSVYVRGFGGQGTDAAYVNYLDGLRQQRGISYAVPNVDPWLLERIEVLRGPASVLYGQSGSGGIVNLVSRRPTEETIHEVRLEAGSHGLAQTAFDLGGKVTEDGTFLYRLSGIARTAGSQVDYNDEQRIAIAPALTWRPDKETTLTILANYQYDPDSGFYGFVPASGTVLANRNGQLHSNFFSGDPNWNHFERRQASIGYQFERQLDDVWTFRQNFRYQHIDSEFRGISIRSISADGRTLARAAALSIEHVDSFALDNQAQAVFRTGGLEHVVLGGLDYSRASAKRRLGQANVSSLSMFSPAYGITVPTINAALTTQIQDQLGTYLQDQMAYGRWHFTLGIRQDFASSETVTRSSGTHTSQFDTATTWRAGALYRFDNGLAPYASYATSFLPNSGTYSPARGGTPFDPTTGQMYEVGVKFQPDGYDSFIQLAGFQITQQNVLTTDPNNTSYSIETGEIRSRGIELEGRATISRNLDLIGTYTYTNAVITSSAVAGVTGNQAPVVPKHMASAWANYRFREGALAGLGVGGGVRYLGTSMGDQANSFHVPAATLYDASIRYDLSRFGGPLEGVEATLNVTNLFDKEYVSSCSSTTACFFGLRRMVLGGIRYTW
ncbi:TonB-dependent siderophore receptor [Roseomonas sp. GC11]|uniref:TonB-dependent siderophore receptor n=1 Tax=Roseomonas sp. GC11 TaxID=2950546 RepID=UPI00210A83B5|nr:TonB-dependent siderophore receptor [Roseomonas sp. GC11]MCQ4158978.1 TonB-dependent siderophore receptor [Roseomonas sp. GC11]